jgi:hypothetical protein
MRFFTLILFSLFFSVAHAGSCSGKIGRVQMAYNGTVELFSAELYGDNVGRKLCNATNEWNGVSVDACKGWYSLLLSTVAQDKEVYIQYPGAETCIEQKAYNEAGRPHMLSNK